MEEPVIDMQQVKSVLVGGVWLSIEPGTITPRFTLKSGDTTATGEGMTAFRHRGTRRWVVVKDKAVEAFSCE